MKIVLINTLYVEESSLLELKSTLKSMGHLFSYYLVKPQNNKDYINRIKNADVLIVDNTPTSKAVLQEATHLKYIDVAFTGFDHIDIDYCIERGIKVSNASGYSTESVSELTIGLIIAYLRKIPLFDTMTRLSYDKKEILGTELSRKTIGIFGFGKIGRRVAELLKSFNVEILATSHNTIKNKPCYVEEVNFQELLKRSDIITIHAPLNSETRNLFDYKTLLLTSKNPVIINTARGHIINQDGLIKALDLRVIDGAALDVYDIEPPLKANLELLQMPNVVLLPHVGYFTKEAMKKRFDIIKDNLLSYINGDIKNRVA